jgi:hypothetical protein
VTKALTVTQPFASLIAAGVKQFETRSWSTNYRGLVLIHAAKNIWGNDSVRYAAELHRAGLLPAKMSKLPRGAIIAIAQLVDVIPSDLVPSDQLLTGPWSPAAYAWRLEAVVALPEPLPWRGRLSLWDGPDVDAAVHAAVAGVTAGGAALEAQP